MNDNFKDPEEEKVKEEPTLTINAVIIGIDLGGEKPTVDLHSKEHHLNLTANLPPRITKVACGLLGVSIKATLTPATGFPVLTLTCIDKGPTTEATGSGAAAGCDPRTDFGRA